MTDNDYYRILLNNYPEPIQEYIRESMKLIERSINESRDNEKRPVGEDKS